VTGYLIARWEGILFMGYFIAYLLYLILQARHHEMLALYSNVMLIYVIPITVVTLVIVMWRSIRARRERLRSVDS
jgi:cation:H+ antiporter